MRIMRTPVAAALLALIVALTGMEAPGHEHDSAIDGWHDASPHGCEHQPSPTSCSICRLAHERSIETASPHDVARPDLVLEAFVSIAEAPPLAAALRPRSSRAPPRATC